MLIQTRDFAFEVKKTDDTGTFEGYGSVFGVTDSYREVVAKGAFTDSLKSIKASGRPVPVLWQHRTDSPIGIYTSLEEDSNGLYVKGQLLKNDVRLASEAYALVKAGAVSGLSIGYYVESDSYNEKENLRTLLKVDLKETSLVTFPANDESRVEAVKKLTHKLAVGDMPSLAEFERFLSDSGFTRKQSIAIANGGLKQLLTVSDSGGSAKQLADVLSTFTLPSLDFGN